MCIRDRSSTAHLWDIYEENALALKLRSARFVRAISARGRLDLLAAVPDIAPARISVLHVGVDVPETAPAAPTRHAGTPFALLCAANLVRKKGHADLLRAVAAVRSGGTDVRLTLAGDGDLRDNLEALVRELQLGDACLLYTSRCV